MVTNCSTSPRERPAIRLRRAVATPTRRGQTRSPPAQPTGGRSPRAVRDVPRPEPFRPSGRGHPSRTRARAGTRCRTSPEPRRGTGRSDMKAVVYKGPREIAVEEVPDARIEAPTDAVVRITTTNICGSDLHMYEGRSAVESGKVLG